jgi:serine protease Do
MRTSFTVRTAGALMGAAVLLGGAGGADARDMPQSFAPLAKELSPAVVNISTTKEVDGAQGPFSQLPEGHPLRRFFDEFTGPQQQRQRRMSSLGSGFIVDDDGVIVTNHHVVKQASEIRVILHDDTRVAAEVVGSDPKTDLAVLRIDTDRDLTEVDWGNSETARVGDWTLAIGNPFGLGGSVTAGIISARGRDINAGPYSRFIQTDTAINRGNSGGPLFNMDGDVIGVNTAILSPSGGNVGVGFALPSRVARPIVSELRETGDVTRGWLGVSVQPLTRDLAAGLDLPREDGALVGSVSEGGPADRAGLQSGDVIVAVEGEPVENASKLAWRISQTDPGSEVRLTLYREGERIVRRVTLGELSERAAVSQQPEQRAKLTQRSLGVKLAAPKPRVLEEFDLPRGVDGAVVVAVARGGPAASRGLRPGDVIARVGQTPVEGPEMVHKLVRKALEQGADGIVTLIRRDNQAQYVSLPLANPSQGSG